MGEEECSVVSILTFSLPLSHVRMFAIFISGWKHRNFFVIEVTSFLLLVS